MGAQAVVVFDLEPAGHPQANWPLGPNTVTPVITVRIATARPAQQRDGQRSQRVEHIGAEAILVRNFSLVSTDPQSLVTAAAEVLRK